MASPLAGHAVEVSTMFDRGVVVGRAPHLPRRARRGDADPATFLRDMARADAFELIPV
ncbi:MAG TPA: hypothetical protein VFQ48_01225 [Pseudonocardiaceae bacterium]|nr:hypothetical protein [Pseudonocardiaceae bacterium]